VIAAVVPAYAVDPAGMPHIAADSIAVVGVSNFFLGRVDLSSMK
jgi:hypothetical protein